jgi:uncharacterized protein YdeI (YjbR/CyaY-like superfamily)
MNRANSKADFYFRNAEKGRQEFEKLRTIILDCPLTEEVKWGCPCYTFDGKNIYMDLKIIAQFSFLRAPC